MTRSIITLTAAAALTAGIATAAGAQPLPPAPVPPENPITEPKRLLGKILFWDEQLSSDDTVACGTCHIPSSAGADPRPAVHPGSDGVFGNADDVFGSLGVVARDETGIAINDPVFGFDRQVTGRAAQSYFGAMYHDDLFWDGRASTAFEDPLTQTLVIPSGGGLESQSLGPILSSVEMAQANRVWADVTDKLAGVVPLRLASNLPTDVAAAITVDSTYPELFDAAFGTTAITPVRIAFAIATYERTLVANQTPWDLFMAGDNNAMTPQQIQGWNFFDGQSDCDNCHVPPLFSNDDFHNIGLRPSAEDTGRIEISGDPADIGDFKTPSLRNIGLRSTLMHTGRIEDVQDAMNFYREAAGHDHFTADQDQVPGPGGGDYDDINIPQNQRGPLREFLENALTDPRVENEQFPFDRPTLNSELSEGYGRCASAPEPSCRQSAGSRLKIRNDADDARDALVWKWGNGEATTAGEFADPTVLDGYSVCFYDGSAGDALIFEARAAGGEICGNKDCWKQLGSATAPKGYRYADSALTPDGLKKVKLKAGATGSASIAVKAKGSNIAGSPLGLPSIPMPLPLLVQIQGKNGNCWESSYDEASTNEGTRFSAD